MQADPRLEAEDDDGDLLQMPWAEIGLPHRQWASGRASAGPDRREHIFQQAVAEGFAAMHAVRLAGEFGFQLPVRAERPGPVVDEPRAGGGDFLFQHLFGP